MSIRRPATSIERIAVAHHRDEQLGAVGAVDLEHLDGRQREHPPHEADRRGRRR